MSSQLFDSACRLQTTQPLLLSDNELITILLRSTSVPLMRRRMYDMNPDSNLVVPLWGSLYLVQQGKGPDPQSYENLERVSVSSFRMEADD